MKKILFPFILFVPFFSSACDCIDNGINPSEEIQKSERENSECILIGKISEVNPQDQTFKVTVVESLDGSDLQGNVYIGKNWKFCWPYVEKNGFWLIYGGIENGYLRPNICGLSRSFDSFGSNSIIKVNNEDENPSIDSLLYSIRKDFLNSLHLEIKALRERKWRRLGKLNTDI